MGRGTASSTCSTVYLYEPCSTCDLQGQHKLVCGSGDGVLYLFNWGEWGNMSDRFPGHASAINCMVALSDDMVCTGSSDGKIRWAVTGRTPSGGRSQVEHHQVGGHR